MPSGEKSKLVWQNPDYRKRMSAIQKIAQKGRIPWNKGLVGAQVAWNKGIKGKYYGKRGNEHHNWNGNGVSYTSLHSWIRRNLGSPMKCELCRKEFINSYQIHWANKSGKYLRDFSDWIRLCVKCHKKYDLNKVKLQHHAI